jgi:hypothetical protein
MKKTFVLVIALCFSYTYLAAQKCGRGTKTLSFFGKNQQQLDTIYYEVIPAYHINFAKLFPVAGSTFEELKRHIGYNIHNGVVVTAAQLEECMLNIPDSINQELRKRVHDLEQITTKGIIKNGEIKFPTHETDGTPYLVKLTAGDKTVYFINNLLGGCNRTINFLWDNKTGLYKCGY